MLKSSENNYEDIVFLHHRWTAIFVFLFFRVDLFFRMLDFSQIFRVTILKQNSLSRIHVR